MKLNLLLDNPADARPGWVNVDPFAPDGDPLRVRCDPTDLEPVADAGEADELLALGVIDYLPLPRADAVLGHWLSRLARGGTIAISAVDLLEVTKSLHNRLISVAEANVLLYGEQQKQWQFRQSSYTAGVLAAELTARGLRVLKKRVSDFRAIVVAQRP